jgi:hypothetical protein
LKRIAVAYARPGRRAHSNDNLPDREYFPLFLRCRELGAEVRNPIRTILSAIGRRAELDGSALEGFEELVSEVLASSQALLLIDGLDEIADDGDRLAFVSSLRTFVGTYAGVALIVTSREAGFRVVAGAMAADCARYMLDDFNDNDIDILVTRWHAEVYGDTIQGQSAAQGLVRAITSNGRIRNLAGNPLLLTTLLLVRRWVGQLPSKRTVLYDKAIEVLLMTWNVQAHAPISLDEALPRLEYVAYAMLSDGIQTISLNGLRTLLESARKELPEALAYSRLSDSAFIDKIELRSSLLIQVGHTVEEGRLVPIYEFRHLTFQEYLAARAIIDGHYPSRSESDTPATVLLPYLQQESWFEVIPMAAVLAGREARGIIRELVSVSEHDSKDHYFETKYASALVLHCLLDEVQLAQADLDRALKVICRLGGSRTAGISERGIQSLAAGKFGERLKFIVYEEFATCDPEFLPNVGQALSATTLTSIGWTHHRMSEGETASRDLIPFLNSSNPTDQAAAALVLMEIGYGYTINLKRLTKAINASLNLLEHENIRVVYAECWALAWLLSHGWRPAESSVQNLLRSLARLFVGEPSVPDYVRCNAAWALGTIPVQRPGLLRGLPERQEFANKIKAIVSEGGEFDWPVQPSAVALDLAYYLDAPYTRSQLLEELSVHEMGLRSDHTALMLKALAHEEGRVPNAGLDQDRQS